MDLTTLYWFQIIPSVRIEHVSKQLNLPAVTFACKPFVFTMRRLLNDYKIDVKTSGFNW